MRRTRLGDLEVSRIGLGCMSMTPIYGEPDPNAGLETLRCAADLGIDLLDTSDAYGKGMNEELIGRAIRGQRNRYVIATKFGNLRLPDGTPVVDGRPEYVPQACDASLRRLGIDCIDLYYLHRFDPKVPIEDTVGAMGKLVAEGKVRHIGLSETSPATLRRAQATHPIAALQSEYSLFTRDVETEILGVCRELGIGFVAYSPLGRGFLTGTLAKDELPAGDVRRTMPRFQGENFTRNLALLGRLQELANAEHCTTSQLAIAWLLTRGDDVVPIAGTSKKARLEENAAADRLSLSDATRQALEDTFPVGVAAGARTSDVLLRRLGL